AVATPRANGQVERLNRTIMSALTTSTLEEDRWDENIRSVQFAINNFVNNSIGKTPSELLLGYSPRSGVDMPLKDEVATIPPIIENLLEERQNAADRIQETQKKQKKEEKHQERTKKDT